jgi:hypothetical protein
MRPARSRCHGHRKQLASQRKVASVRLWRRAVVPGVRVKQAFPFISPEWDEFHDHARQSIESLQSGFKDEDEG